MSNIILDRSVGTLTIKELFEKNLEIPSYQRPYSWEEEQVIDLIEDLSIAFNSKKDKYLIGNMIFHQENSKLNIVDGQQRTTTLALILKVINENSSKLEFLNEKINSLSYKFIFNNYKSIQSKFKNYDEQKKIDFSRFIYEKVIITYIKANTLDEAFMLFDSQNTRGKPLDRKDLLKVHHIRFIKNYDKQKLVAQKWEKITKKSEEEKLDNVDFVLNNLILIRKAVRHELNGNDLVQLDVFKEFKTESYEDDELNNYNQPPIFEKFDFDIDKKILSLLSKDFKQIGLFKIENSLEFLPFEIPQSISGGEKFFWFTIKYHELVLKLKQEKFFNVLDNIYGSGNIFLQKIYQSLIILFVDKFGFKDCEKFALRVAILLLAKRLNDPSIRKEGVVGFKWINDSELDIYKLVFLKYSSNLVLKELEKYIECNLQVIAKPTKQGTKQDFFNAFVDYEKMIKDILGEKYVG
jgi:uncharacterized protein with ParB-like and HNH nuclease domain